MQKLTVKDQMKMDEDYFSVIEKAYDDHESKEQDGDQDGDQEHVCFVCKDECNPASQMCGPCARGRYCKLGLEDIEE